MIRTKEEFPARIIEKSAIRLGRMEKNPSASISDPIY